MTLPHGLVGKGYRPTIIVIFVLGSIVCGLIIWGCWPR
jgi:hypothetical protein